MKRIVWVFLGWAALLTIAQAATVQTATAASSVVNVNGTAPSKDLIIAWWEKNSNAKVEIGDIKQIGLQSHELAYLASATFDDEGRNGMFGAVLIRPKLEEVQDVSESVGSEFEVYDLDHDGVSEVVSKVSGSGQGTEIGDKLIVLFDEWNPVVLHQVHFETGSSPDLTAGTEEKIDWKFVPKSDTDRYAKLVEAISINNWSQGPEDKHPKDNISRESNTYKFINKKFEKERPPTPSIKIQ